MASRNLFNARPDYNYPTPGSGNNPITGHDDVFELDEADVWDSNVTPLLESKKTIPSSRCSRRAPRKIDHMAKDGTPVTCASLPVTWTDPVAGGRQERHLLLSSMVIFDSSAAFLWLLLLLFVSHFLKCIDDGILPYV
ncbi:hypothetical protein NC651_016046 [Populus alba x Populus x berolinensis]|nr:hypothetical protein NC651_016046 [Populus alba x Populus x berolinensis]